MSNEIQTINQRLNQLITQLKHLYSLENKKKNQEQQIKTDKKYRDLVLQITQLCQALHFAQDKFSFPYQPQEALIGLLNNLKAAAINSAVSEDIITQVGKKVKPILDQVKKEWSNHYQSLVGTVVSTLTIVQKINPAEITPCLTKIQKASSWQNNDTDLSNLTSLSNALTKSSDLINQLNLDQEIIGFLSKVSAGTATLNDLSINIMTWIQEETLSDKIMISFKQ